MYSVNLNHWNMHCVSADVLLTAGFTVDVPNYIILVVTTWTESWQFFLVGRRQTAATSLPCLCFVVDREMQWKFIDELFICDKHSFIWLCYRACLFNLSFSFSQLRHHCGVAGARRKTCNERLWETVCCCRPTAVNQLYMVSRKIHVVLLYIVSLAHVIWQYFNMYRHIIVNCTKSSFHSQWRCSLTLFQFCNA